MLELAKANPDLETLKMFVWLGAGIIILLLSVVSFFLSKQVKVQEALTKAVNQLTTTVEVLKSQNEDRHPVIVRRLNSHASRLDEHDKRITKVETTCNINHP